MKSVYIVRRLNSVQRPWLLLATAMVIVAPISPALMAQVPTGERKLEFDVASIRENKTSEPPYSNFPLGPGPIFGAKDGLLLAKNQTLLGYIFFAFKPDMLQSQQFQAQLPGWVKTTNYDIEARASGSPTKDDLRLMMRSLLEERFHLVIHREMRGAGVRPNARQAGHIRAADQAASSGRSGLRDDKIHKDHNRNGSDVRRELACCAGDPR